MGGIVPIAGASVGAALVAGFTLLVAGMHAEGALLAVRNTARFSSVVFVVALLASSSDHGTDLAGVGSRFRALAARRVPLVRSFVAAHLVHYGAVLFQMFVNPLARRHPLSVAGSVVLAFGLTLVLLIAFTSAARTRAQAAWNRIALWAAAASFLLALVFGASRGHRIDVALSALVAAASAASAWLLLRARAPAAASPDPAP